MVVGQSCAGDRRAENGPLDARPAPLPIAAMLFDKGEGDDGAVGDAWLDPGNESRLARTPPGPGDEVRISPPGPMLENANALASGLSESPARGKSSSRSCEGDRRCVK